MTEAPGRSERPTADRPDRPPAHSPDQRPADRSNRPPTTTGSGLEERFVASLSRATWPWEASTVVVGVSGGLDSMTLLHLFLRLRRSDRQRWALADRRRSTLPDRRRSTLPEIVAVHLDHRMSPGSGGAAQWVEEMCEEWGVSCHVGAAPSPPSSEAEGRTLRYRFFEEARREAGSGAVVATGHTADDQAETVLFRIARGAGLQGMRGVLPERPPGVVRPLLPFWRRELAAYAAEHGVPFRDDPTNLDLRWTRNRLRHEVLPALEEAVPGAASALAALAAASGTHVEALDHLLDDQIAALVASPDARRPLDASAPGTRPSSADPVPPTGFDLDHRRLLALPDAVVALALRRAVSRLGGRLGRAATRDLLRFAKESQSGRRIGVAGGVTVTRDLDRLRINVAGRPATSVERPAAPEVVVAGKQGEGRFATGRLEVHAAWGPAPPDGFPLVAPFVPGEVRFPLAVRPWRPGDWIEARYGKKKVKKLLLEARIPTDRRTGYPVLADATGKLLWVPGATDPRVPLVTGTPQVAPATGAPCVPSVAGAPRCPSTADAPCWVGVRVQGPR